LAIGWETWKRRVFRIKNERFVGDFEDFGVGNETAYYYIVFFIDWKEYLVENRNCATDSRESSMRAVTTAAAPLARTS
jgi:hypothetical protein